MTTPPSKSTLPTRLRQIAQGMRARIAPILPPKWAAILLGLALLISGQALMTSLTHQGKDWNNLWEWSRQHHIDIVNLENTLQGGLLLTAGGLLCAWLCSLQTWQSITKKPRQDPAEKLKGKGKSAPSLLVLGLLYAALMAPLVRHHYAPILLILWLVMLAAVLNLAWKRDQQTGIRLSPQITLADVGWMLSILAIGFAVGALFLEDLPALLIPDEGSFWETASAIANGTHRPPPWGPGVYTFPIASSILQGWLMRIFGINLWGWRFSSVIPAVLSSVPLYLLLREWFNRRTAIAACLLMFVNPYFLAFARMGYNNAHALLPVTLSIYWMALAAKKSSVFYYVLSGLTAGLGAYTYPAAWLGLVTIALSGIWLTATRQKSLRQAVKAGLIVLGSALAMLLPQTLYTLSGTASHALTFKAFETSFFSAFYARAVFTDSHPEMIASLIGKNEVVLSATLWRDLLLRGTIRTLVAFFNPHLIGEHFMTTGFAGGWMGIFFLIGLFAAAKRIKDHRFGTLVIWLVSGVVFLGILAAFPPRHTHLIAVLPAIAALSGLGLIATAEALGKEIEQRIFRSQRKQAGLWLYATGLLVLITFGLHQYFVIMPEKYRPAFEDVVSWNAWRKNDPAVIYYIEALPDIHKVEYLTNRKLSLHRYINLASSSLDAQMAAVMAQQPVMVFYPEDDNGNITQQLLTASPLFRLPVQYRDAAGNTIGYGTTNITGLQLLPDYRFERGLRTLIHTPVAWVLAVLLLALAFVGIKNLPASLSEGVEFEFKIRFTFSPPRKKTKDKNPKEGAS